MPSTSGKVTLTVRITEELHEWLRTRGHRTGLSRSEVVEMALHALKRAAGEEDA